MNSKLQHVIAAVYDKPWFITQEQLRIIDQVVQAHVADERLTPDELHARLDVAAASNGPRRGARTTGAVQVIPIYGSIFPRSNLMTSFSGGATIEDLRATFRDALADDTVGSILFDVDSPGGYVDGVDELAAEILAARGQKPMVAISNYGMASAAYYLACSADELVASPSAMVGWIGTVMIHQEFSKMDEMAGVTTTIFRDPPGKYGGNEFEPLSDQARSEFQQTTDDYSRQFHNHVAKARGVSVSTVRADFGKGGGLTAARAKAAGMVDRVDTFDGTLRRLATGKGPVTRGTSATGAWIFQPEADQAAAAIEASLELDPALAASFDETPRLDADGPIPPVTPPEAAPDADDNPPSDEFALDLAKAKNRARSRSEGVG